MGVKIPVKIIEDWKKALNDNTFVPAILMGLSMSFDCLQHELLLLKMKTYGLSNSFKDILQSYSQNRKRDVKINKFTFVVILKVCS